MTMRVCIEPGCPELIDKPASRCWQHERQADKARGTKQQRGYDSDHDHLRAAWQQRMNHGLSVNCWRCSRPINPTAWTLGHCDLDRAIYHGPECPPCDYATAGRTGCPHPSHH